MNWEVFAQVTVPLGLALVTFSITQSTKLAVIETRTVTIEAQLSQLNTYVTTEKQRLSDLETRVRALEVVLDIQPPVKTAERR